MGEALINSREELIKLSDKEQQLYDFIKEKKEVTVATIKKDLGEGFAGVLGGLKSKGFIDTERKKGTDTPKFVTFFKIIDKNA